MVRPPCSDKLNAKKGICREEVDVDMPTYVSSQGIETGIRRCGKSCRVRRTNNMRNDVRHESFTPQEEELIIRLHAAIGSRWPIISQQLPGRTENDVKNYWNTKLKKKLSAMGIDPVTHRPFSQMLADYGNISGLTRTRPRIGSLNNQDIKTAIFTSNITKPIPSSEKCTFPNFNNIKMEPSEMKTDSLDLLTQLQAITLVKEASIPTTNGIGLISLPQFRSGEFSSLASSSTSSSASSSTLNEVIRPSQNFDWQEFLLENAQEQETGKESKVQCDQNGEEKQSFEGMGCSTSSTTNPMDGFKEKEAETCEGSFVEVMLDGGNDMLLDFPGLLDGAFSDKEKRKAEVEEKLQILNERTSAETDVTCVSHQNLPKQMAQESFQTQPTQYAEMMLKLV